MINSVRHVVVLVALTMFQKEKILRSVNKEGAKRLSLRIIIYSSTSKVRYSYDTSVLNNNYTLSKGNP